MAIAPTPTPKATGCITNSISLQPGTSFILPPGSTLIGTSNISSLTSTCADLTKIEQTECYALLFAGMNNDHNGATEYSDNSSQFIRGFIYNNVYTAFSTPIINNNVNGSFDMEVLRNRLIAAIPAITGSNIGYKLTPNANPANSISALVIKTLPSVAGNLLIIVNNDAPLAQPGSAVQYRVAPILMSDYISTGYVGLPTCP